MADGGEIRRVLLEEIEKDRGSLQSRRVLNDAWRRLQESGVDQTALLVAFGDLFRTGHVGWGLNVNNPDPPFMHITEQGRRALSHLSRDPLNPAGYMAHLNKAGAIGPVADSYVREALRAYAADCYKSTAVMVGAASERMVLDVGEVLATRVKELGHPVPNNLTNWKVSVVLTAIANQLSPQKQNMPQALREEYEGHWSSFTAQIRMSRNEAGHPVTIEPVTQERVHASLLIFPELATLANKLKNWIARGYS